MVFIQPYQTFLNAKTMWVISRQFNPGTTKGGGGKSGPQNVVTKL